ncbi:MAG: imidazole glycerol phosphate synthase subunit HisH [Alphaproteobacteria bacterium]|nr:imidazole glycerol phosphate synthase subunit HisH [Alphaproteobacteria bacterium]MBV9541824.1 imidazole glycerol phosphate synthase subunit HisH [Alphaproteobacteria bacterium]MBV9904083.1 imidazole glycerol phosphate synthase subunit HisH [Alphaproteobacteria bacterium]
MRPVVAIVDYGSGNLRSAEKALARVAHENATGQDVIVTSDASVVAQADRIVLPGVGAYADCMNGLSAVPGMVAALNDAVIARGVPFLGICVGMQLMASVGREFGDHAGLDWIKGEVVKMTPNDPALKIPQIGWNELNFAHAHPVLEGLTNGAHAYFVHSYAMRTEQDADVLARTDYGGPVTAIVGRDNLIGVQFHPEKSQAVGLKLLANFLSWRL